ncbi:MAG: TonB-dependent hemoglobin/transferrin/lactoferrin family receptor [Xanthomonadales bacterium]|nr:TonB-dependent hemoglobin/transferrin/lactoferrin family receptor [Xanthomonadales bacterium]NIX11836.1 TonB-dependent hemoglobin/transferrin/lactoferrin family receptor [Xanthomonadales bacterium]
MTACVMLSACPVLAAPNQETPEAPEVPEVPEVPEEVVVVASKAPRPLSAVAGQVSVIDAGDIEQYLLEDMDDLVRYEPGLTAETSGTRFGLSGLNLRGIGGNRVAIEVDGVPVRDRFAIGSYSNGGRALVETDRVRRLEVLHGPASSLYGSDAIGGVMSFTTWDPFDLLERGRAGRYFSLRTGYRGADESTVLTATAVAGRERTGFLLSGTRRDGHEAGNMALPGFPVDRQDWDSEDWVARLAHDTRGGHRLRLSVEDFERQSETRLESILGFARFRSTTALSGIDRDRNRRISADFAFSTDRWENGVVRLFESETTTNQKSLEERAAARTPVRLERLFSYESELRGGEFNLFRSIRTGGAEHVLGFGLEVLRTKSDELRDGFQQTIADGSITKTVLGEDLPVRDFPVSVTDEFGVFIQDEITLAGGRWDLVPALRYDRYELGPRPDAIYLEDNPSSGVVAVSEAQFTPRLGAVRHFDGGWNMYGQYVRGFRAPPFEDANIGLDIPLFNIRALPNPDLGSETSEGFELGLRRSGGRGNFSVAIFHTDYDDFIETRARIGVDPATGVLLFQSRNIERARIRGLDVRFVRAPEPWRGLPGEWGLHAAAYWSEGENRDSGQPLNSISPPQAVLGLAWSSPEKSWQANLTGTLTARQDEVDLSAGARFETPGYGVVDLTATYRPFEGLSVSFGAYNLGDRRYWRWSDVANLRADDPMIEPLSRPGRNYSISIRVEF